jgi:hypothetical protein
MIYLQFARRRRLGAADPGKGPDPRFLRRPDPATLAEIAENFHQDNYLPQFRAIKEFSRFRGGQGAAPWGGIHICVCW